MPTFSAKIRTEYGDLEGLVLDCRESGLAADGSTWTNVAPPARPIHTGSHTGANNQPVLTDSAANWRTDVLAGRTVYNLTDGSLATITGNSENQISGTLAGGVDNDWDTGDLYRVATPRFGNPYQDTVVERPVVATVGGYQQATFSRAAQSNLIIPLDDGIATTYWTAAFEYLAVAASAPNDHPVLYFPNWSIWRQNAAGNYKYRHGAVDVNGVGDMTAGTWLMYYTGAANGELDRNGVLSLAGSHSAQALASGDPAGYLCTDGAGNYCDMILRSIQVWDRMASPREVDFAFQSLSCEFDYEQLGRADIALPRPVWTDETGPNPQDVSRLNFSVNAPQRFYSGTYPTGGSGIVQIAASVDGLVLPDVLLGVNVFDIKCVEYPSAGHPAVFQDAGWSAVWDVVINTEGHYTFVVYRVGSGSQVLHLDMEAV